MPKGRRSYGIQDLEQTRPHLFFTDAELDILNNEADRTYANLSAVINRIVRDWLNEYRRADADKKAAEMVKASMLAAEGDK